MNQILIEGIILRYFSKKGVMSVLTKEHGKCLIYLKGRLFDYKRTFSAGELGTFELWPKNDNFFLNKFDVKEIPFYCMNNHLLFFHFFF